MSPHLKQGYLYSVVTSNLPHVDMEGIILVDLKATRPNTIGNIHQSDTQQLIIVIPRPVENHTGTRKSGDVTFGIGCSLKHVRSLAFVKTPTQFRGPLLSLATEHFTHVTDNHAGIHCVPK